MRWTTRELRYLAKHANDGAEAIGAALGRSKHSVELQASRLGISLRPSWFCPKCGQRTFKPLSTKTGWCICCTKKKRREELTEEMREMQEELRREEQENKARQAIYSQKNRFREDLKVLRKV